MCKVGGQLLLRGYKVAGMHAHDMQGTLCHHQCAWEGSVKTASPLVTTGQVGGKEQACGGLKAPSLQVWELTGNQAATKLSTQARSVKGAASAWPSVHPRSSRQDTGL